MSATVPGAFNCFRSHSNATRCARLSHTTASGSALAGTATGVNCFSGSTERTQCHRPAKRNSRTPRNAYDCFTSKVELARCRAEHRAP
jgi:hypothetical protein